VEDKYIVALEDYVANRTTPTATTLGDLQYHFCC